MKRFSSIFSQLLQLFPRLEFEKAVQDHQAERHARGFASWNQFIAMLFCQLGRAHSLREICGGLRTRTALASRAYLRVRREQVFVVHVMREQRPQHAA